MPMANVDGRSLHFLTGPSGLAPRRRNILFIHGAGGSGGVWQRQRLDLDRGVNTVCLDLPGHGLSPGPGCDTIAAYADCILRFVAAVGLDRTILAGHSMGGATVLEAAIKEPELAEALVLMASGARLRVNPALLRAWEEESNSAAHRMVESCYGPDSPQRLRAWSLEQLVGARPEVVLDDWRACDRFDRMGQLDQIRQPALVVCGTLDRLTPPKFSHYLADRLPRATLTLIDRAGHMVMLERAGEVNRAMLRFLAAL
jgi:pimeloyl-ACP methyl ester carboxylesterase